MVTSLHLKVIVIGVGTCTLPGGGANDKLQEKVFLKNTFIYSGITQIKPIKFLSFFLHFFYTGRPHKQSPGFIELLLFFCAIYPWYGVQQVANF